MLAEEKIVNILNLGQLFMSLAMKSRRLGTTLHFRCDKLDFDSNQHQWVWLLFSIFKRKFYQRSPILVNSVIKRKQIFMNINPTEPFRANVYLKRDHKLKVCAQQTAFRTCTSRSDHKGSNRTRWQGRTIAVESKTNKYKYDETFWVFPLSMKAFFEFTRKDVSTAGYLLAFRQTL